MPSAISCDSETALPLARAAPDTLIFSPASAAREFTWLSDRPVSCGTATVWLVLASSV